MTVAPRKFFGGRTLWLASALFSLAPCAIADAPVSIEEQNAVGRKLVGLLDLERPELHEVRRLAEAQKYAQALSVWRDLVVVRLRNRNYGQFNWHGYKTNARQLNIAERLVGRLSEDKYRKADSADDFFDIYGMSGPVGKSGPIQWLATSPDAKTQEKADYSSYQFAIPLAASFWKTADANYAAKWFEITSDFARNQKLQIEQLDAEKRKTYPTSWTTDAGAALTQSWRAENIIKCLAVFAKSLPAGKAATWDDVLKPVKEPVERTALDTIPPRELAEIAISLVQDHPAVLKERYLQVGAAPSQRRIGLTSLVMIATAFPEFQSTTVLNQQAGAAFLDYANSMFYRDGGMLEQAFGYNAYDARSVDDLISFLQPDLPPWAIKMAANVNSFRRMTASLATPLNGLPVVGNESADNPPAIWNDATLREQWLKGRGGELAKATDPLVARIQSRLRGEQELQPPFTSVAFPYSGYYALRRNWNWDSPYLFFMGARPANGHHNMDNNAIQLTAYGRPMLVAAGPPPYNMSFVSDEKRAEFAQLGAFFDEGSTWKMNTILVDGKSQSRNGTEASRVYSEPIPARWHTSSHFDFVEGTYALGYGEKYVPWAPPKNVEMAVQHQRQVVFVREAGFWIVSDILRNSDNREHEYTQIWNFPPREAEVKNGVMGFSNEKVVVEPMSRIVHTTDASGPNLWLYSFGAQPLRYTKYFGDKNPYRGWYARGIGDAIPAANVHVGWKAVSNQVLTTVLYPVKNQASPIAYTMDLSPADASISVFTMRLKDLTDVTYANSTTPQPFSFDFLNATATLLLLTKDSQGKTRGIVLGCTKMAVRGQEQAIAQPDFEFELEEKQVKSIVPIEVPKSFKWQETGGQFIPRY